MPGEIFTIQCQLAFFIVSLSERHCLCPAFAMFSRYGEGALKETFVMSNVIQQYHGLNAGEWEQLETAIAGRAGTGDGWAGSCGTVWVINGPIYDKRPASEKLRNGTWVPASCFSVVLRRAGEQWDALAVVMPNQKDVAGPVSRYLTSITFINHETDLDLLAGMPSDDMARLAQERATTQWR